MRKNLLPLSVITIIAIFILQMFNSPGQGVYGTPGEVKGQLAYEQTRFLVESIGPRPPGSKEEQRAAEYIGAKFSEYGWRVSTQDFSRSVYIDRGNLKKYSLIKSCNVVAVKPGKSEETVIIGAHYDSADFNVPGANDNASGVGVLLELAEVLGKQAQDNTYVLVAFGAEEAGLVGSKYFAETYDLSKVRLMINMDMVGEGKSFSLDGGGKISTPPWLLRLAYDSVKQIGYKPDIRRDFMLLARDSREGGTSDFSPFLDRWVPSVGIGQGGRSPAYFHQPADDMKHVNKATLAACGNLVLNIARSSAGKTSQPEWNDNYLTIDSGVYLFILPAVLLKAFVVLSLALTLWLLVKRRKKTWLSLAWLVPFVLIITSLTVFLGHLPELGVGLLKGLEEPWHAYPEIFFLVQGLSTGLILYFVSRFRVKLPEKLLPRSKDVYWAGSAILLALGTCAVLLNRWDFATYFAFWLLLVNLSTILPGGLWLSLLAPLPVYWFHWQVLTSHLGSDIYRTVNEHPFVFIFIYGFGSIPLYLSSLAQGTGRKRAFVKPGLKEIIIPLAIMSMGLCLVPAYSEKIPQPIIVRQEWENNKLSLVVTGKDNLPKEIGRALGASGRQREIRLPLKGEVQPFKVSFRQSEAKLKSERLITLEVSLNYSEMPHMIKLKLKGQEPFTLVNGGEFYPLGRGGSKVKLSGEPVGGIYGLVLERGIPQPRNFSLYIKAQGPLQLTLEAQYPKQFIKQGFEAAKTSIKYENWVVVSEQI